MKRIISEELIITRKKIDEKNKNKSKVHKCVNKTLKKGGKSKICINKKKRKLETKEKEKS